MKELEKVLIDELVFSTNWATTLDIFVAIKKTFGNVVRLVSFKNSVAIHILDKNKKEEIMGFYKGYSYALVDIVSTISSKVTPSPAQEDIAKVPANKEIFVSTYAVELKK